MRYIDPNRLYRMVRLMKAGDIAIPIDVEAFAIEQGFDVTTIPPAAAYQEHELRDTLEAAGLDADDVLFAAEAPVAGFTD